MRERRGTLLLRAFALLGNMWGLGALTALLATPGDPKNAWLLGYSTRRVGAIAIVSAILVGTLWLTWKCWRHPEGAVEKVVSSLQNQRTFSAVFFLASGVAVVGGWALFQAFLASPSPFQAYFVRLAPVSIMVVGLGMQLAVLAGILAKESLKKFLQTWTYPLATAFVILLAWQRLQFLWPEYAQMGLDPDVSGYKTIANGMRHPYDTGIREPVLIWLVKAALLMTGGSDLAFRYFGLALFVATGILLWMLAEHTLADRTLALLAWAIFFLNTFLMRRALAGTRDNLFMLAVVGMTYFAFSKHRRLSALGRLVGLTGFLILGVGTQLTSFAPLAVLLLYAFVRNRIRLSLYPIVLLLAVLVFVPYLYVSSLRFGDPFIASNVHAVWWRNYEFVVRRGDGCEGCPSLAAIAVNSYAGAKVTVSEYLLGMHSIPELVEGVLRGLVTIYFSASSLFMSMLGIAEKGAYLFLLLHGAGIALFLEGEERWLVFVPLLVMNLMYFFIPLGMDYRIAMVNAPFMSLFAARGGVALGRCMFQAVLGDQGEEAPLAR